MQIPATCAMIIVASAIYAQ